MTNIKAVCSGISGDIKIKKTVTFVYLIFSTFSKNVRYTVVRKSWRELAYE